MQFAFGLRARDVAQHASLVRHLPQYRQDALVAFDEAVDAVVEALLGAEALHEDRGLFETVPRQSREQVCREGLVRASSRFL